MTAPLASLHGIVKRFRGVTANDHVDIDVRPGEILAILGENGAGKSTAMQILYGLYRADAGEIRVDGHTVAIAGPADAIALGIGMVHQEFMLVAPMRGGRVTGTVAVAETCEADLARRMVGRDVVLRLVRPPARPGATVLTVTGLAVRDASGRERLRGVDLTAREGEILGIAGVDGNGQSELADALLGLAPAERGRIVLDGVDVTHADVAARRARGMGFVPADRRGTGAFATLPIADNAVLGEHRRHTRARGMLLDRGAMARQAQRIVDRFGVRAANLGLEAGKLSGGNLQRLILGREIARQIRLLVVEQPTRGLDVGAVEAVWQALLDERARGRAILLISAELEEILNLSDRIAVLFEGRIAGVVDSAAASMEQLGLLMAGRPMPLAG